MAMTYLREEEKAFVGTNSICILDLKSCLFGIVFTYIFISVFFSDIQCLIQHRRTPKPPNSQEVIKILFIIFSALFLPIYLFRCFSVIFSV